MNFEWVCGSVYDFKQSKSAFSFIKIYKTSRQNVSKYLSNVEQPKDFVWKKTTMFS